MRRISVLVLLFIMFIPLLQRVIHFLPADYVLNGYSSNTDKPVFSLKSFFNGDYQEQETNYLQGNAGYRGFLIGLKNQIDYSVFHILHYTIEEGKDGQLFYWNHIDTHCGDLGISSDSLARKMDEYARLKALLNQKHIQILYVLAPGKPNFYEDKLPKKYAGKCRAENNDYTLLLASLKAANMPVIDFNQWFKTNRDTFSFPVFPKLGTHWSFYAACLATDSLSRYITAATGIDLPVYKPSHIRVTDQPYKTDKDLASLLNILFPLKSDSLAYPEYDFKDSAVARTKPKIIFVGDSYTWNLIDTKLPANLFSPGSRYWFYKRDLYDLKGNWITSNPAEVNMDSLLDGAAMVIFLSTEVSDHWVDYGFFHALTNNKPQPVNATKNN